MANIKVSELTTATQFNDEDYAMIVQSGENKKITKENMFVNDINNLTDYKYQANENVDVVNNTDTSLNSITLNSGLWVLIGMFSFAPNTSGNRRGNFSTVSGSGDMNFNIAPASASATRYRNIMIYNLSETTTIYANVRQTSGSSLSCFCQMWAVRVGDYKSS